MTNKLYSFKLLIKGPGGFTAEYDIPIGVTTIGRDSDNLLQLDDTTISRHHARLECVVGECSITDLGSSNGTFINKIKVPAKTPIPLGDLEQIGLGPKYEMIFTRTEVTGDVIPDEGAGKRPPEESPEPPLPPLPPLPPAPAQEEAFEKTPPGLPTQGRYLLKYLPEIYQTEFMENFLGIFEAIQLPIIWTIDNFDLFLSPRTAPLAFLPWLANWYEAEFDSTWSETQRRQFLEDAWLLYARRGTKWSLSRVLEIYTGKLPVIDDLSDELKPHSFQVTVLIKEASINRTSVENLINYYKPAHTDYELIFHE
jgi:phage tail-like protein